MRTEDGYLIYKCLNGDPAAFGLLVDKYKGSIYALAYSKLGNFHDAEDVTQEVFIKAFQKLRALRRWDSFYAWLYAITANLCKQWIRSQSKRPDRAVASDQEPGVLRLISADSSVNSHREELVYASVSEALESLPEKYRQILALHYLGGMTYSDMSRFLGVSISTVTKRLKTPRDSLKAEMMPT